MMSLGGEVSSRWRWSDWGSEGKSAGAGPEWRQSPRRWGNHSSLDRRSAHSTNLHIQDDIIRPRPQHLSSDIIRCVVTCEIVWTDTALKINAGSPILTNQTLLVTGVHWGMREILETSDWIRFCDVTEAPPPHCVYLCIWPRPLSWCTQISISRNASQWLRPYTDRHQLPSSEEKPSRLSHSCTLTERKFCQYLGWSDLICLLQHLI